MLARLRPTRGRASMSSAAATGLSTSGVGTSGGRSSATGSRVICARLCPPILSWPALGAHLPGQGTVPFAVERCDRRKSSLPGAERRCTRQTPLSTRSLGNSHLGSASNLPAHACARNYSIHVDIPGSARPPGALASSNAFSPEDGHGCPRTSSVGLHAHSVTTSPRRVPRPGLVLSSRGCGRGQVAGAGMRWMTRVRFSLSLRWPPPAARPGPGLSAGW